MLNVKAEILAAHFNTTAETMLQHNRTDFVGLFRVDGSHYTCAPKEQPVPAEGFNHIADVVRNGAAFGVYRTQPKYFARWFISKH